LPPLEVSVPWPDEDLAALQPSAAEANLAELLTANLKTLIPMLADQSDETLAGLARIEGAAAMPRKSLLAAIAELQLQRALVKTGAPE
jgi:hypothetical protein